MLTLKESGNFPFHNLVLTKKNSMKFLDLLRGSRISSTSIKIFRVSQLHFFKSPPPSYLPPFLFYFPCLVQALHVTYPFLPTELRQHLPQLLTHRGVEGRVVPPGAQHVYLDGVHVRLAELAGLHICGAWKRVVRVHDVRNTFNIHYVSKISRFWDFVTSLESGDPPFVLQN